VNNALKHKYALKHHVEIFDRDVESGMIISKVIDREKTVVPIRADDKYVLLYNKQLQLRTLCSGAMISFNPLALYYALRMLINSNHQAMHQKHLKGKIITQLKKQKRLLVQKTYKPSVRS
jgi:hypothetical protein